MEKNFTVNGVEFTLTKWTMKEQLERQNIVLPVVSGPLTTAIAYSESAEESYMIAAIISGLVDSLAEVNMVEFANVCLNGVSHRNENGVKKVTTLNELEKMGFESSDVYVLLAAVIKVNYGGLLKKDLQDSLQDLINL